MILVIAFAIDEMKTFVHKHTYKYHTSFTFKNTHNDCFSYKKQR